MLASTKTKALCCNAKLTWEVRLVIRKCRPTDGRDFTQFFYWSRVYRHFLETIKLHIIEEVWYVKKNYIQRKLGDTWEVENRAGTASSLNEEGDRTTEPYKPPGAWKIRI